MKDALKRSLDDIMAGLQVEVNVPTCPYVMVGRLSDPIERAVTSIATSVNNCRPLPVVYTG